MRRAALSVRGGIGRCRRQYKIGRGAGGTSRGGEDRAEDRAHRHLMSALLYRLHGRNVLFLSGYIYIINTLPCVLYGLRLPARLQTSRRGCHPRPITTTVSSHHYTFNNQCHFVSMATIGVAIIGSGIFVKEQHIVRKKDPLSTTTTHPLTPPARRSQMQPPVPQGHLLPLPLLRRGHRRPHPL